MAQQVQNSKPTSLNLDKSFKDLSPTESYYLLNHVSLLTTKGQSGNNSGKGKPLPANYAACLIDQPGGENYVVGGFRSPLTNELYSHHYNSNGVHYILRINNNGCQIVYLKQDNDCYSLDADPQYSIEQFRGYMWIEKVCPNRDGKQYIWTNGNGAVGQIDVEAAIATNFFTTPFFDICRDSCAYVQMCVPEICGCIKAEFIPLALADIGLSNNILDQPFQFAIQHIYYDGRKGIWSDRSTTYYQNAKGCFDNTEGFSRCLKLRVPIGNPMVDRINIGYTTDGVNWNITETVDKYKKYNTSQDKWYNRELSEQVAATFSDTDCSFDYIFCNDKQKIPIDPLEISRVRNPMPRNPQGILPVKNSIGFYNYEDGNCPVDKFQTDKFDIQLNCDNVATDCNPQYVTVTGRALIIDFIGTGSPRNQFIFRQNGVFDLSGTADDLSATAYFGGIRGGILIPAEEIGYDQQFRDKTRNFIAYSEGTDYWGDMKQWFVPTGIFTDKKEIGVVAGMSTDINRFNIMNVIGSGAYFFQEFKIRVLKGTRGFLRLTSHEVTNGVGANQNTSTFVVGIYNDINNYRGNQSVLDPNIDYTTEEIYFDTCAGDVEFTKAFVIADESQSALYTGYITDLNGLPVEGAIVSGTTLSTDHNGFYHFDSDEGDQVFGVKVEIDCTTFNTIQNLNATGINGSQVKTNLQITSPTYATDLFLTVQEKVVDCNGNPVAGLRVAISGSKYRVTDGSGVANFRLRNYSTRNRVVKTVLLNGDGCIETDCSQSCNPCMPTDQQNAPACFLHKPILLMANLIVNINSANTTRNGLKAGGRYPFGIIISGDCGRMSAVYEVKYIDIPKTQVKGVLSFCNFSYNGNGIILPEWANCLKIVRGANLNPYQLQWKIDKIEKTINGDIKLTIQSLNDYNEQYDFQTNTVYQWARGDRVEFIKNGDGNILTIPTNPLLNYLTISPFNDEVISGTTDSPANFFNQLLIQDDGRLDSITEGAIIEIQRPLGNVEVTIYYEVCASIGVNPDGTLVNDSGTFHTFDTFFVNRNIGSFVGIFEHFSPSDFWGDPILRVSDAGKPHVVNKFENERRFGRNISLNSPTQFNYFGDLVKTFDAPEQGDIIGMDIKDGKIIGAICENDNFLAESADDLVRVSATDNTIRALSANQIISDAQPNVIGAYGCKYEHVGSIYFGDGYFCWTSAARNARVVHDYNTAKDVSQGKTETYYRIRCQQMESHNKSVTDPLDKYRFATGYDASTEMLYQTIKTLRQQGFNNESKSFSIGNDTLLYHPLLNDFFGYASFTPEFYGNIDLSDDSGCSFVCYLNSTPYVHPVISDRYNEFFGIACDEIMGITLNKFTEKMKLALAIEIQSTMAWFAKEITNGNPNFVSEIPVVRFKRSNDKWNSAFLNNKNSRAGLYGNNGGVADQTRGFYVNITFVRDNTIDRAYNTIDPNKQVMYNETDNVYLKFQVIEESGFTSNL